MIEVFEQKLSLKSLKITDHLENLINKEKIENLKKMTEVYEINQQEIRRGGKNRKKVSPCHQNPKLNK